MAEPAAALEQHTPRTERGRRTLRAILDDASAECGDVGEEEAWAIVGMNVFVGLRYGVWDEDADPRAVAERVNQLLRSGLAPTNG